MAQIDEGIPHEEHQRIHKDWLRGHANNFLQVVTDYSSSCFEWFKHQGFWREDHNPGALNYGLPDVVSLPRDEYIRLKKIEKIALMHSELTEMLEAVRNNIPWGEKGSEPEEAADLKVRLLDYCGGFTVPLAAAYINKMEKNFDRPHRHGKAF